MEKLYDELSKIPGIRLTMLKGEEVSGRLGFYPLTKKVEQARVAAGLPRFDTSIPSKTGWTRFHVARDSNKNEVTVYSWPRGRFLKDFAIVAKNLDDTSRTRILDFFRKLSDLHAEEQKQKPQRKPNR